MDHQPASMGRLRANMVRHRDLQRAMVLHQHLHHLLPHRHHRRRRRYMARQATVHLRQPMVRQRLLVPLGADIIMDHHHRLFTNDQ